MNQKMEQDVLDSLDSMQIRYTYTQHEPAMTMDDLTAVDQRLGVTHLKNLFLCNRQKTEFYLLLLRGDQSFRTAVVSKQLGVARLSFASPELLKDLLQMEPGGISPLGLLFDREKRVQLLMDQSLQDEPVYCVHPCVNTASVVISRDDFLQTFLARTGHRPRWVHLDAPSEGS